MLSTRPHARRVHAFATHGRHRSRWTPTDFSTKLLGSRSKGSSAMAAKGKGDWPAKRLGNGTAVDVPKYLRDLQSKDADLRVAATKWFTDALLDRGPYPDVASDVVQALVDILDAGPHDPAIVIELLVEVSLLGHADPAVAGVNPKKLRGALKKAYQTFCSAKAVLERLLTSPDARTRAAAAFGLAFIMEGAPAIAALLQNHITTESDSTVVASCLLALGLTARHGATLPTLVSSRLESDSFLLRTAAAIALGSEAQPAPATTTNLVLGLTLPHPNLLWFEGRLAGYALRVLTSNSEGHVDVAIPALQNYLGHPNVKELDEYAKLMLADATIMLGFAPFAGREGNPVTQNELSPKQLELLKQLETLGRRTATFGEYGLPREPSAIGLLTGNATAPLDRLVTVLAEQQSQTLPIWKVLHLVSNETCEERQLAEALKMQVPKAELFAVLTEACSAKNRVPVAPAEVIIECIDWLGADALELGRKLADELAKATTHYSPALAVLSLNSLVRNGVTALPDEYGAVAAILAQAMTPLGYEAVFACLSPEARARFELEPA